MSYAARPLELAADQGTLVRLWSENLRDPLIRERAAGRVRWLYEQAPGGPACTWLGVDEDKGEVIGCASCYPRATWAAGRAWRGAILADFAVDRAHRVAGPAVAIQRALARGAGGGFDLVYGWPNNKSAGVFKRVGYRAAGETTTWMKPLRSLRQLRKRWPARLAAAAPAAPLAARVVDAGLALDDWRRIAPALPRFRAAVVDRADQRFDELWSRARPAWIMGEKSSAYLNWRYAGFPTARYRFYTLSERDGRLAAYLAYTMAGDTAVVADLFAADLEDTLDHLLVRFARRAHHEGAATLSLTFLGCEAFTRRLPPLRFFPRPTERSLVVYVNPSAPAQLREAALDGKRWFMLDGELDI